MADGLRRFWRSLEDADLVLDRLARSNDPRDQALYRELMDGEGLPPKLYGDAMDTTDELKEG